MPQLKLKINNWQTKNSLLCIEISAVIIVVLHLCPLFSGYLSCDHVDLTRDLKFIFFIISIKSKMFFFLCSPFIIFRILLIQTSCSFHHC